jgi:cytochrome c biogenesis factor
MGISWLFMLFSVFYVVLLIAVLIFLMTRWSRHPRPVGYALAGIGLMLFSAILGSVVPMLVSQMLASSAVLNVMLGLRVVSLLIEVIAWLLIVKAILVDRENRMTHDYPTTNPIITRPYEGPERNPNPYSS